ncbi:uncharacterized protein LOC121735333 [Aricia agestis]|uniref:uncharacterized protein LOC121735333 n=1 Tax=Aricia agestis TaxID=91739 RepID=UPI001C20B1EA|nr:uncharacterized protein LOC121735333 [Aricia agestis]
MGSLHIASRLAMVIIFHAAGAGLAAPSVLVTRLSRLSVDWLPMDNQTLYVLEDGEYRNLELNTSLISQKVVYITISPCSRSIHWALYNGPPGRNDAQLNLVREYGGSEMQTVAVMVYKRDRYVLQLSASKSGAVAVSVRGEAPRLVRSRLRVRSRRRLAANWDASPIDPQETTYCVVASHRKNYTSLCAAQYDAKISRSDNKSVRSNERSNEDVDNQIDSYDIFDGRKNNYRRKKFGRSTRVSDADPVVACVGDRTHHLIENLDTSRTYFISVFGIARDRRAGNFLTSGTVRPRTSTARRLRENTAFKADIKGKNVFYFKSLFSNGIWLAVSTCGGSVDVEVSAKGKRLYIIKDIEPHSKFFVPAPIPTTSMQETSDESSVQFDSSSEESKIRYVIRVIPNKYYIDGTVTVELTASTSRWGMSTPELMEDGATVRELRPRRSCKSVDVAFLPATHNATDVIRYCILAREMSDNDGIICALSKRSSTKAQCISHMQRPPTRVIIQKVAGLKAGRKYAVQVTASNKGSLVPYNILYVDTNTTC